MPRGIVPHGAGLVLLFRVPQIHRWPKCSGGPSFAAHPNSPLPTSPRLGRSAPQPCPPRKATTHTRFFRPSGRDAPLQIQRPKTHPPFPWRSLRRQTLLECTTHWRRCVACQVLPLLASMQWPPEPPGACWPSWPPHSRIRKSRCPAPHFLCPHRRQRHARDLGNPHCPIRLCPGSAIHVLWQPNGPKFVFSTRDQRDHIQCLQSWFENTHNDRS